MLSSEPLPCLVEGFGLVTRQWILVLSSRKTAPCHSRLHATLISQVLTRGHSEQGQRLRSTCHLVTWQLKKAEGHLQFLPQPKNPSTQAKSMQTYPQPWRLIIVVGASMFMDPKIVSLNYRVKASTSSPYIRTFLRRLTNLRLRRPGSQDGNPICTLQVIGATPTSRTRIPIH